MTGELVLNTGVSTKVASSIFLFEDPNYQDTDEDAAAAMSGFNWRLSFRYEKIWYKVYFKKHPTVEQISDAMLEQVEEPWCLPYNITSI